MCRLVQGTVVWLVQVTVGRLVQGMVCWSVRVTVCWLVQVTVCWLWSLAVVRWDSLCLGLAYPNMRCVAQELGLVGLRIQRMAVESGQEFNNPANYPYLTVASPSCHDVEPIRAW